MTRSRVGAPNSGGAGIIPYSQLQVQVSIQIPATEYPSQESEMMQGALRPKL